VGQFYGAYGIALDSTGRIYVADTYNARVVRIDDMAGTNWISFGEYGSGIGQFNNPTAISIDAGGRIYVMDTGNNRLVRMERSVRYNWIRDERDRLRRRPVGAVRRARRFRRERADLCRRCGKQAHRAHGRHERDELGHVDPVPVMGMYSLPASARRLASPDASGRIYVLDAYRRRSFASRHDRANWTSIGLGSTATPHNIAIDASGMVLVGGGGAPDRGQMAGFCLVQRLDPGLWSLLRIRRDSHTFRSASFRDPLLAASLTFSQDLGTTSSQTITHTELVGAQLNVFNLSASAGFSKRTLPLDP